MSVGFIVLLIKLVSPNKNPSAPPFFGPRSRDAMMTGTCMIVARNGPIVIYPRKGVNAIMIMIAPNIAVWTIPVTLILLPACFLFCGCLPVSNFSITASLVIILFDTRYNTDSGSEDISSVQL